MQLVKQNLYHLQVGSLPLNTIQYILSSCYQKLFRLSVVASFLLAPL